MSTSLTDFDTKCLNIAISVAKDTSERGNYPVGAVLTIDGQIIDQAGNEIQQLKSSVNHAENMLIIRNGNKLYNAWKNKQSISLYSTLEPCVLCLGAAVITRVDKIFYIQKDPHGGACDMKHDDIGTWYRKKWPEINYVPISQEPLEMMVVYFKSEIAKGNTAWPETMLKLLKR